MKKKLILSIVFACSLLTAFSQDKKTKRKAKLLANEAQYHFDNGDYGTAWTVYREVLRLDPGHQKAGLNAAVSMFNLNYPVDSAKTFEANLSASALPDAAYYLARIRHQQKSLDEAISLLTKYQGVNEKKRLHNNNDVNYLLAACTNARNFIAKPNKSIIKNMGPAVNSPYADYVPVIVPDESALYFTSKRENQLHPRKNGDNNYFEDVYVCYKNAEGWSQAENIGFPVNTETNDGCVAVSPDGQRMIVYRTSEDVVSGDLYITRLGKNNRWEPLTLMPPEINSPDIETSACFSNDTSEIYFSSNRPGGMGGKDIYRIRKLPKGNWSQPFNLGPAINTAYDEDAPFLHPDGVTLYFSSKGHNTMGEYDVFRSVLNPEENQFSPPENLGYPINDIGNDIFFVLNVDGQRGYYSSVKKETLGDIDIYEVDTRFGENDLKVRLGNSYLDGAAGRVRITLVDKENNEEVGIYLSNPDSGKFILVVNPLKPYKAIVEAEGYATQEIEIQPMAFDISNDKLKFKLKRGSVQ